MKCVLFNVLIKLRTGKNCSKSLVIGGQLNLCKRYFHYNFIKNLLRFAHWYGQSVWPNLETLL